MLTRSHSTEIFFFWNISTNSKKNGPTSWTFGLPPKRNTNYYQFWRFLFSFFLFLQSLLFHTQYLWSLHLDWSDWTHKFENRWKMALSHTSVEDLSPVPNSVSVRKCKSHIKIKSKCSKTWDKWKKKTIILHFSPYSWIISGKSFQKGANQWRKGQHLLCPLWLYSSALNLSFCTAKHVNAFIS